MAGKSASLEKALGKVALGMVAAGGVIAVESVRAAAKFQQSMELIHTQAGATQVEVNKLSKAVLGLAGTTATGPNELAAGLYHLESSGFRGAKAMAALKTAAEGAKLGNANLEDVTNALNAVLVSGIKGAQNMTQAMGALNATVGAGDMRMQDLAEALGTGVLAVVKGFGVSLKDASAALATFGDNNIRGADAGTQLRMSVLFLADGTKKADKVLKDIGLSSRQLREDMAEHGLGGALADLHTHLVKAGDTGAKMGDVLLQAFGHKAGVGLSILEGQYARFQQKQEEVHKGSRNFASDWTAYTQTFGYSWDRAKSAFESMTIQLGTKLLPTATHAMNWIGTKGVADLQHFSTWVSDNKRPIKDIAEALAAIAAFKFASNKLNDVSRILGVGGKGAGALGGAAGALGSRGGSPTNPLYVWDVNGKKGPGLPGLPVPPGEKPLPPAPRGPVTRVLEKLAPKAVQPLSKFLAYADPASWALLTSGDSARVPGALKHSIQTNPYMALDYIYDPKLRHDIPGSTQGGKLDLFKMVSRLEQTGTPQQKQMLTAAAAQFKDVAHAVALYQGAFDRANDSIGHEKSSLSALHSALAANAGAVNDSITALKRLPGAWQQLQTQAKADGKTIGEELDAGITVGIRQGKSNIDLVSIAVIDGVKHVMNNRASIQSPSKMTAYIGRMLAEGLSLGMRAGKKGVGQAASEMMDTVRGNVMGAGSLGNVAQFGAGVDSLGASGGGGTSIRNILAFTHAQVAQDRAFARNLAVARKHGLSRSVAQQIAMLGPDQGAPLAASIAGASRAQVRRLNADEAAIGRYGRQIGGVVEMSDATIRKLGHELSKVHVTVRLTEIDKRNGKRVLLAG